MVEEMFKSAFERERDLFRGKWKDFRGALLRSLDTRIGTVLIGSDTVPVTVGHMVSGRLYEKVVQECLGLVDLCIYSACEHDLEPPLFETITAPLLYHTMTQRAWSLFKCWDDTQARERLVPELARPEKARSISKPTPFQWHEIEMPEEYDCRGLFDEILNLGEELYTTI
jgi:hypothetical protein